MGEATLYTNFKLGRGSVSVDDETTSGSIMLSITPGSNHSCL